MQKSRSITDYFTRLRHKKVAQDFNDDVGDIIVVAQRPLSEQRPGKREWPYSPPHKKLRAHISPISQTSPTHIAGSGASSPTTLKNGLSSSPSHPPRHQSSQAGSASESPDTTAQAQASPQAVSKTSALASAPSTGCLTFSTSQDGSICALKSQSSTASTLRVSKNGMQIVRSSDDEEDDTDEDLACEEEKRYGDREERTSMDWQGLKSQGAREGFDSEMGAVQKDVESDSDSSLSSLEDLDELFASNKRTAVSSPNTATGSERKEDDGRSFRSSRSTQSPGNHTLAPTSNYTISLDSLLARHKKDLATQADVAQAKERMSASVREASELQATGANAEESPFMLPKVDRNLLVAVLEDGEEDGEAQRVLHAAQRTEALEYDMTWFFFESEQCRQNQRRPFPAGGLPSAGWANLLKDKTSREQAFLSGFVRDIAVHKNLPDDILTWMLEETTSESRRELRYSYIRAIQNSGRAKRSLISSDVLANMLQRLGASPSATTVATPILPVRRPVGVQAQSVPDAVFSFVDLLRSVSSDLSVSAREYAVHILLRMILDINIRGDGILQFSISDAIAALITDMSDAVAEQSLRHISSLLVSTIEDTTLRLHILNSIPSTTSRLHTFRCALARPYFLCSTQYDSLSLPLHGARMIPLILHRLSKPPFTITKKTDYASLAALVTFLDALVDSGFSIFPIIDNEEEKVFNENVDALARQLRNLSGRILDSGASHLKRTECKVVLDRLVYRLEFAVRTKAMPRKNLFGGSTSNVAGDMSISLMEQFVKRYHPPQEI